MKEGRPKQADSELEQPVSPRIYLTLRRKLSKGGTRRNMPHMSEQEARVLLEMIRRSAEK